MCSYSCAPILLERTAAFSLIWCLSVHKCQVEVLDCTDQAGHVGEEGQQQTPLRQPCLASHGTQS